MVDTYGFGDAFQRHALAVLCRIPGGVVRYRSALDHTYFGTAGMRVIAEVLFAHVDEHRALPQQPTLLEELRKETTDDDFKRVEKTLTGLYRQDISDYKAVLLKLVDFGKQQAYVNATLTAAEKLEKGDQNLRPLFDAASLVGEDLLDLGVNYRKDAKDRFAWYRDPNKQAEDRIRTGIPHLDAMLDGGLSRGELGVVLAPPKRGKCVRPDARVWTPEKGYVTMAEAARTLPHVVGVDETTQKVVIAKPVKAYEDGRKITLDFTLRSGRDLLGLAKTHPVLTTRGWVAAGDLLIGDFVIGARELPLTGTCSGEDVALAWLHGVMCGDGGLTDRSPHLHLHARDDADIVRDVRETFPGLMDGKPFADSANGVRYTLSRRYFVWLEEWGAERCLSNNKRIPAKVWTHGKRAVSAFLAGLFDTDGSAYLERGRPVAEFGSASRDLMWGVVTALHTLGIYTGLREKTVTLGDDSFKAWIVALRDGGSVAMFRDACAQYGSHGRKWSLLEEARKGRGQFYARLPHVVWERLLSVCSGASRWSHPNVAEVFRTLPLRGDARKGSEFARRAMKRKSRVSVEVARRIGEAIQDAWITNAATGAFVFDEIVGIGAPVESETLDLEVPGTHSFVVDGVITHNTTTLINIAFGALTDVARRNVLHYSLEMDQDKIMRRYDDRLMGSRVKYRKSDPDRYARMVEQRVQKSIRGELFAKNYATRTATVSKLRSHLSMLAARGFHPDLIIVDYADIMQAERRLGEMRHEQAGIYEDLRQLAGEFNCVIWTASQTGRGALEKDIITIDDFAEAFEKAAIVDAAVGFCQTNDERIEGKCRLFGAALRNQEDGRTVECEIRRNECRVRSVALYDVAGEQMVIDGVDDKREDYVSEKSAKVSRKKASRKKAAKRLKDRVGITGRKKAYKAGSLDKKAARKKKSKKSGRRRESKPSNKVRLSEAI